MYTTLLSRGSTAMPRFDPTRRSWPSPLEFPVNGSVAVTTRLPAVVAGIDERWNGCAPRPQFVADLSGGEAREIRTGR
jgi:hypothetical protein